MSQLSPETAWPWFIAQASDADLWARRDVDGSAARALLVVVDGVPILDPMGASEGRLP